MCGVLAILSSGAPIADERAARALEAMRHRGPDGRGTWRAPDGRALLGHVRLAVIDRETGAQPIANETGDVLVAVNGELYDFERIRRELEARGHVFRTRTDAEIALHLYEEHGDGCVEHLRGEFALVVWDARRARLFAARDRFGAKPLVWARAGDGALVVASEAKALFAAGVRAAWDAEAVFFAHSLQYVPPDRTLFAGVRAVAPGHVLVAERGEVTTRAYWDLDYPPGDVPPRADAVRAVKDALEDAVRVRLRADVPVGCYLSGGLDSTAVTAIASRLVRRPLDVFTVAFDHAAYDERRLAEASAARFGARLHVVHATPEAMEAALPDAVAKSEGLAINAHLPAKYLLARAVKEAGTKVVLTGEGADEIFAGYAHLRHDLAIAEGEGEARLLGLFGTNAVSAGIMLPDAEGLPLDAVQGALGAVPSFLAAKAAFGRRMHALLDPDFAARFSGVDPYARMLEALGAKAKLAGRHPVHRSLYVWTKLALGGYIVRTLGDGTEMAHGVEGRLPFLDGPLVDVARALPVSLKIARGVEKHVLREAVAPLVGDEVARREKHPFLAPPGSSGLAEDVLRGRALPAFFDRRAVIALLDRLPAMDARARAAHDPVVMQALTATLLEEGLGLGAP